MHLGWRLQNPDVVGDRVGELLGVDVVGELEGAGEGRAVGSRLGRPVGAAHAPSTQRPVMHASSLVHASPFLARKMRSGS